MLWNWTRPSKLAAKYEKCARLENISSKVVFLDLRVGCPMCASKIYTSVNHDLSGNVERPHNITQTISKEHYVPKPCPLCCMKSGVSKTRMLNNMAASRLWWDGCDDHYSSVHLMMLTIMTLYRLLDRGSGIRLNLTDTVSTISLAVSYSLLHSALPSFFFMPPL
jgi:hypothetical protein